MDVDVEPLDKDAQRRGHSASPACQSSTESMRQVLSRLAGGAWSASRLRMLLLGYWLTLFVGTHVKLRDSTLTSSIRDKVLHFLAYAGLSFLAASYLRLRRGHVGWIDMATIWIVAAAYGIVDEITQIPVGRTADPLDWLADIVGAAMGLAAFIAVRRWMPSGRPIAQTALES